MEGVEDRCDFNYVNSNIIEPNANECVDIKEGSIGNVIEYNTCANQLDDDSGCFNSRGDANTFRCAGRNSRVCLSGTDAIFYF